MVRQSRIPLLAEEGRMRHRAKPPKAAQTGWSDRHVLDFAELTTPALRATPPLRGGECVNAIFKRNTRLLSKHAPHCGHRCRDGARCQYFASDQIHNRPLSGSLLWQAAQTAGVLK